MTRLSEPWQDQCMETTTDPTCEYCEDNPAEPNMTCCANSVCVGEFYRDADEAKVG